MPIKEGEHVYVIFEDNGRKTHGLWLTRAPDNKKTEQLNLVPGEKKYKDNPNNDTSDVGIEQSAQSSDLNVKQIKQSDEFAKEDVPDFTARIGDRVIQGSNNTLILLSRDRIDDPSSGQKKGSGTIFLVAGRQDKEKLNLKKDQSLVIVSSKTDIDNNLGISVGDAKSSVASVALVSDEVRAFAKKGMKLVVDGGDLYMTGKNLYFADKSSNTEPAVLGKTLSQVFSDMLDAIGNFQLPTPAGPAPLQPLKTVIQAKIQAGLNNMLSKTINLKKN